MINDYGSEALATATRRAQELRSEGFESIANTWDLICEAIKDRQGSKTKVADSSSLEGDGGSI